MKETEYRIGDVAKIVGLSCDALRFYEKKGIIKAKKKPNGYRCYSEEDLYKLMYIVYHRKMNASLEEIDGLLGKDVVDGSLRDHLRQRIEEEKIELRRHIQAITRLRLVARDLDSIESSLKHVSIREFPKGYVVDRCVSQEESVREWFRISSGESGLDMTYFYNVFSYEKETGLTTEKRPCLYCVVRSENVCPEGEVVEHMREWGKDQGVCSQDIVYVNAMMTVFIGEKLNHYLEIYIPTEPKK